jgi:hypothetical protein
MDPHVPVVPRDEGNPIAALDHVSIPPVDLAFGGCGPLIENTQAIPVSFIDSGK